MGGVTFCATPRPAALRDPGGKAAYHSLDMEHSITQIRRRYGGSFALPAVVGALIAMALATLPARAQPAPDAADQPGTRHQVVDFAFVKSLMVFPGPPNVTIVDSRSADAGYNANHIPRAVNIPTAHFEQYAALLPLDRRHTLVFYCADAECEDSRQLAGKAAALGFSDVRIYAGGFVDWHRNGGATAVSAEYIRRLGQDRTPHHTLVDARPARTAAKGMIPGAINIPDSDFDKRIGQLPQDKGALLIYYCGGIDCPQSASSAEKARKLGYTNVHTYPEGYPEWVQLHQTAPVASDARGE